MFTHSLRMKALLDALEPDGPDWDLAQSLDPDRLPAHIAVIMDGNGRWARARGWPRPAGHRAGQVVGGDHIPELGRVLGVGERDPVTDPDRAPMVDHRGEP